MSGSFGDQANFVWNLSPLISLLTTYLFILSITKSKNKSKNSEQQTNHEDIYNPTSKSDEEDIEYDKEHYDDGICEDQINDIEEENWQHRINNNEVQNENEHDDKTSDNEEIIKENEMEENDDKQLMNKIIR